VGSWGTFTIGQGIEQELNIKLRRWLGGPIGVEY